MTTERNDQFIIRTSAPFWGAVTARFDLAEDPEARSAQVKTLARLLDSETSVSCIAYRRHSPAGETWYANWSAPMRQWRHSWER